MPRPQKNGMNYFPHDVDASSDEKIEAMRTLFGNDGYAFYFILLERIYHCGKPGIFVGFSAKNSRETIEANQELPDNADQRKSEMMRTVLAAKIGVSVERFNDMIDASISIGLFDAQAYETHGLLTSHSIQETLESTEKERAKARERYYRKTQNQACEKEADSPDVSREFFAEKQGDSLHKGKERKGEERKEEKRERSAGAPPSGGELALAAPSKNRKTSKRSAEAKEAAAYLKQKLTERGVTVFERDWNLKNSAVAETLLRDGLSPEDLHALIDWCLADAFWGNKIHDLLKVRDLAPRWQQQRQKQKKRSVAVIQLFDEQTCEPWEVPFEDAEDIRCGRKPWPPERDAYLRELEEARKAAWQSKEQIS